MAATGRRVVGSPSFDPTPPQRPCSYTHGIVAFAFAEKDCLHLLLQGITSPRRWTCYARWSPAVERACHAQATRRKLQISACFSCSRSFPDDSFARHINSDFTKFLDCDFLRQGAVDKARATKVVSMRPPMESVRSPIADANSAGAKSLKDSARYSPNEQNVNSDSSFSCHSFLTA
jgi:hypothetical protein